MALIISDIAPVRPLSTHSWTFDTHVSPLGLVHSPKRMRRLDKGHCRHFSGTLDRVLRDGITRGSDASERRSRTRHASPISTRRIYCRPCLRLASSKYRDEYLLSGRRDSSRRHTCLILCYSLGNRHHWLSITTLHLPARRAPHAPELLVPVYQLIHPMRYDCGPSILACSAMLGNDSIETLFSFHGCSFTCVANGPSTSACSAGKHVREAVLVDATKGVLSPGSFQRRRLVVSGRQRQINSWTSGGLPERMAGMQRRVCGTSCGGHVPLQGQGLGSLTETKPLTSLRQENAHTMPNPPCRTTARIVPTHKRSIARQYWMTRWCIGGRRPASKRLNTLRCCMPGCVCIPRALDVDATSPFPHLLRRARHDVRSDRDSRTAHAAMEIL